MDYVNSENSLLRHCHFTNAQKDGLDKTWAVKFRTLILDNLPMEDIRKLYCQNNGRPTKDLRAVTGAIILQHLFDLTDHATCEAFLYNILWIEALNTHSLKSRDQSISPRTLWEHTQILAKSGLLKTIFDYVNQKLAEHAQVSFARQRLDSVQICGDMAKLSRIQLFSRTVTYFLKSLKKKHKDDFEALDQSVRTRYLSEDKNVEGSSYNMYFGQAKPGQKHKILNAVASDIYGLLEMFKAHAVVSKTQSFILLQRLFSEQCVVKEPDNPGESDGQVQVEVEAKDPKEVSGDSLQNPSDPDAKFSGHKGQGYHVQLMETCGASKNEEGKTISLITVAFTEGANIHDGKSTIPSIEAAAEAGFKPEKLLCDTAYGADSTVEEAKGLGVEVISPAGGKDPEADKLRVSDFNIKNEKIAACPEGQKPWASYTTKSGREVCGFDKTICDKCLKVNLCPVRLSGGKAEITYDMKVLRLSRRRAREQTDDFKKQYAMRSGIEATNSHLARETGFKKLRYRGLVRIRLAVTFKVIGLNFKRVAAAACQK